MKWENILKEIDRSNFTPYLEEATDYIKREGKPSLHEKQKEARRLGNTLVQARFGFGSHETTKKRMIQLVKGAAPDVHTLTIDAFTRLNQFEKIDGILKKRRLNSIKNPSDCLNGYPLVNHGYMKGRELNERIQSPIQIRHGSPDPLTLFLVSILSGFTAFEGDGITYLFPYSKNYSLTQSLNNWSLIDSLCGEMAKRGVIIDREVFGALTGVLVPPSLSIAISILSAICMAESGVRSISIGYPQSGNTVQDIAALRLIREIAKKYLPENVDLFVVFYEWMGVFPKSREKAEELIFYGGMIAKAGGAERVITKTVDEAFGIPKIESNIQGILTTKSAIRDIGTNTFPLNSESLEEESDGIRKEIEEILHFILNLPGEDIRKKIVEGFNKGYLDIPFSAHNLAKREVLPTRDATGAIRYASFGSLPFSEETKRRNNQLLGSFNRNLSRSDRVIKDIHHFSGETFNTKKEDQQNPVNCSGKVILGVTKSDVHAVYNQLSQEFLTRHNLSVLNLGVQTSVREFYEAFQQNPDAKAIIIGSLNGHAYEDLKLLREYRSKIQCPIFLGGNLSIDHEDESRMAERLRSIGVDHVVASIEEVLNILERQY